MGNRTRAVEIRVGNVDDGVIAEGKHVGGTVVDSDVGVGDGRRGRIGNIDGCVQAVEAGLVQIGAVTVLDHIHIGQVELGAVRHDDDTGVVRVDGETGVIRTSDIAVGVVVRTHDVVGLVEDGLDVVHGLDRVVGRIGGQVGKVAWIGNRNSSQGRTRKVEEASCAKHAERRLSSVANWQTVARGSSGAEVPGLYGVTSKT